jgi:dipeptidyl aminopeptidase/acylaminoacyl peptidase
MMFDGQLLEIHPEPIPKSMLNIQKRAMSSEEFLAFSSVQLFRIVYHHAGLRIAGFLALPPAQANTEKYPAIIFNRGGTGEKGALTPDSASMYAVMYASWGYVVAASNYRGCGGSEGKEEWGGNDVLDAAALLPLLKSLEYVDHDRIGLIGGSRGGMMALMMLRTMSDFRAAITIGAPTTFDKIPKDSYIYKTFAQYQSSGSDMSREELKRSSEHFCNELCKTTPLLVLHGTGDKRVDPMHGYKLGMALQEAMHPYKLVMYENADHILAGRRQESNLEIRAWMDSYVLKKQALPKVGPHGA